MADQGAAYTDKELEKMEKKIKQIYSEAEKDIQQKLADWGKKFKEKNDALWEQVENGTLEYDDYSHWMDGQLFQAEQWESKRDQIIGVIQNANKEAAKILNGGTISVFAENANWSHYQMEKTQGVNFGFGLYDAQTVTNLIKNDPQILPKWKINEKKDYVWNAKKVNNSITQGIIQGEKLDQIADRLATSLSSNNRNTMLTFARTTMTGAQNAGRYQSQQDAKELGINIVKVWMATLDNHTRVSHQKLDGEEQKVGDKWHPFKFSNGCRYPGDPLGPPHEVYNCRCTLVSDVKDYPSEFNRYDNIAGKPIKNMSYKEWKEAKETKAPIVENTKPVSVEPIVNDDLVTEEPDDDDWDWVDDFDDTEETTDAQSNTSDLPISEWIDRMKLNPSTEELMEEERKMFANMDRKQRSALRTYTGSSYSKMNGYYRDIGSGVSEEKARGWLGEYLYERTMLCHEAFENNRLQEGMILRRGTDVGDLAGLFMSGDFYDNKDLLRNKSAEELNAMFQGQVGTYFGFTSTSSQWDRGFDGRVEVIINAPPGSRAMSIMSISSFGDAEGETLLGDNTTVVCEKIEESDGHFGSKIRVFLTVIPNA